MARRTRRGLSRPGQTPRLEGGAGAASVPDRSSGSRMLSDSVRIGSVHGGCHGEGLTSACETNCRSESDWKQHRRRGVGEDGIGDGERGNVGRHFRDRCESIASMGDCLRNWAQRISSG